MFGSDRCFNISHFNKFLGHSHFSAGGNPHTPVTYEQLLYNYSMLIWSIHDFIARYDFSLLVRKIMDRTKLTCHNNIALFF